MVIDFKKKERYTEIKNKRPKTVLLIVSLKEFNYYVKAVDICTLHKIFTGQSYSPLQAPMNHVFVQFLSLVTL